MSTEAPASAEVIVIPKQVRMDWTDRMALDNELSNMAFRAACVIGYAMKRDPSNALSRESIAGLLGVTERSAADAIIELERRGYLILQARFPGGFA